LDLVEPQISLAERVGFRALHLRDWNRVKALFGSGGLTLTQAELAKVLDIEQGMFQRS
jgi:hypothetical protein